MNRITFYITAAILTVAVSMNLHAEDTGKAEAFPEAQLVFKDRKGHFCLTSYVGIGGGASFPSGGAVPLLEVSAGFYITNWLSIGAFAAVNPLSDFGHARLGLSVASAEAAYAVMSGMEILVTPLHDKIVHPLFRLSIGGITAGYLIKDGEEEGYSRPREERFFFASVSAGAELNLSKHTRIALRGGWRFAGNCETIGIKEGGLERS
ncbi:MAG: hypothetical protein LBR47_06765 [Spirochaetaceae bacterium]|jgi:hypothetical protein|nr:hypothetical protein [Spirochaetaceae bacterium]